MRNYKVTFRNDETNKTKTVMVKDVAIVPAIEHAVKKAMLFGWDIVKAEEVK